MSLGRHAWSYRFLSWGLGAVFLWIGIDIWRHPDLWIGYVPEVLPLGLSRELALKANGVFDIGVGASLVAGAFPRITSLLAVLHLVGILLTSRADAVLARDIGLLGASLALLAWPHGYRRKWRLFRKRRKSSEDSE